MKIYEWLDLNCELLNVHLVMLEIDFMMNMHLLV